MKFDELCDFILNEATDKDYVTGKDKVFSLSDIDLETFSGLSTKELENLIKTTGVPFTRSYFEMLIGDEIEGLARMLPAEKKNFKEDLAKNIMFELELEKPKMAARAADKVFSLLKSKNIIVPGIPKKKSDAETIEDLSKELETDTVDYDDTGEIGSSDIEKLGGMVPRSSAFEDESEWY